MNKKLIPTILAGIIMIAGIFAFSPIDIASTVHTTINTALQGADSDDFTTVKDTVNTHANTATDVTQAQVEDIATQVDVSFASGTILDTEVNLITAPSAGIICIFVEAAAAGSNGNIQLMIDNADSGIDLEDEVANTICRAGTTAGILDDVVTTLDATATLSAFAITDPANPADPVLP